LVRNRVWVSAAAISSGSYPALRSAALMRRGSSPCRVAMSAKSVRPVSEVSCSSSARSIPPLFHAGVGSDGLVSFSAAPTQMCSSFPLRVTDSVLAVRESALLVTLKFLVRLRVRSLPLGAFFAWRRDPPPSAASPLPQAEGRPSPTRRKYGEGSGPCVPKGRTRTWICALSAEWQAVSRNNWHSP
jgi:hypothetical protein